MEECVEIVKDAAVKAAIPIEEENASDNKERNNRAGIA